MWVRRLGFDGWMDGWMDGGDEYGLVMVYTFIYASLRTL